ncbi:putative glycosyltransferase [Lewinella marina]|uniref:Glycosyl transferase family 28 C-terminal domain-containing protein n=1 Tax=Neolewinella marina TaxID=438751 RepID=A0A2G0CG41_9BACT|nr:hypothetical protein [Neolewinella marina]NJB86594.1 putative glycosyltransferase [Neolewinella marina]PHK98955.1 hypothetical protein CGL56_05700 [Neolewinella marina]
MSPDPVAFYVHHHGSGHATRTRVLAAALPSEVPVHVFTSAPERFKGWERGTVHTLPPDVAPDRDPARDLLEDQVLHYAPVEVPDVSRRMALIANWIAEHRPAWFIVDLSVEVALFVRLCGVRVALVRLHGHRDDLAHRGAFGLADRLLAPFPAELEDAHTPAWVRGKTTYLGAFSRYDHRTEDRLSCRQLLGLPPDARIATVINGRGGGARVPSEWAKIAAAVPDWLFLLVGEVDPDSATGPGNLRAAGRQSDTFPWLRAADVVVGSGGTNTMFEIGAARVPYLSLPEPRPFDEQHCKMEALQRHGLTRIVPPGLPPAAWREWLEAAREQEVKGWDDLFASPPLSAILKELLVRPR